MRNSSVGFGLSWLLIGSALGAAVALLIAPQSGRRTRRLLERKAARGRERLTDVVDDMSEKGREAYSRGKEAADEAGRMVEKGLKALGG